MPLGHDYKKHFIILHEEEKGYEIAGGKNPTGYVKIEFKKDMVNINGFVQNIAASQKSDYKLLLLNIKKKQVFQVGSFRMGYSGGGEICRRLSLKDNRGMDEYSSAFVITGDKVILFGSNEKDEADWKEWFYGKYLCNNISGDSMINMEKRDIVGDYKPDKATESIENSNIAESKEKADVTGIDERMQIEEITELSGNEAPDKTEKIETITIAEENLEIIKISEIEQTTEPPILKEEMPEMQEDSDVNILSEAVEVSHIDIEPICHTEKETYKLNDEDAVTREKMIYELTQEIYVEPIFNDETYCSNNIWDNNKNEINEEIKKNRLSVLINRLRKIEGVKDGDKRHWYAIDDNISLLNDIAVMILGGKVPLSYLYLAEGCSLLIKNSILGVEYSLGKIVKIFIGIPGINNRFWEKYFFTKGFTEYIRIKSKGQGYWIMSVDLEGSGAE